MKLILSILLLLLSATIYAETSKNINISIAKEGDFDLFYHRSQSTATGAVLGGLIGAGIEEGVRKGKDTKKKKIVLSLVSDSNCKTRFLNKLVSKLEKNNFNTLLEASFKDNKKSKNWLNIKIAKCGFMMVNTSTMEMSAFVDFKVVIKNKNKTVYKNKFSIRSKEQYKFENLIADEQKINVELESVLHRAGSRLASKIIYL